MSMLILLLVLGLILWFWRDSLRARERARDASARACQRWGVQLLDDTVALEKLWLRRNTDGWLQWERTYTFEFTDTGANRRLGRVIMIGERVEVLAMEGGDLLIP